MATEEEIRQEILRAVVRTPSTDSDRRSLHPRPVLRMSRRTLFILATVLLVAFSLVYAYASPYLAISRVRRAAAAGDADTVNAHVDFPALRESVKGWMGAAMAKNLASPEMRGNPFANMGAAFTFMMMDKMADAMITPEAVRMMLAEGQRPQPNVSDQPKSEPRLPPNTQMEMGYEAYDRFIVRLRNTRQPRDEFVMVWRRHGLTWKLAAVRLPMPE